MELEILDYLYSHGGHALYSELLNAFPGIMETDGFLLMLADQNFIKIDRRSDASVTLARPGYTYRSKLHQQADQRAAETAERRADQKKNDRFNKCSMVINIITAVLALLALAVSVYDVLC